MTKSLLEQIQAKKQNIADKRTGSKNPYKFKQKNTIIRILPSWRGGDDTTFYHDFGQSYIKDLDGNTLAVIGDRRMCYGEDDAVRNLIALAQAEAPTDAQRAHYKEMLAKQRHLLNALILNDKDVDPNVPEIIDVSQSQLENILVQMEKILLDGENPLDFATGYNLEIEKEGTGLMTRYKLLFARRPTAIDPKVMENATDLDAFVRSKCADTDRAINAIKSITQTAALPAPSRSISYDSSSVVDAEYSAVEDAKENVREPVKTNVESVSDSELDALLGDLDVPF